jgi:hypothetical protein
MAMKAGVWIDHRQAIVVLLTDAGQEIKRVQSGLEKPVRSAGGSKSKNPYTPNDFVAEDRLERKLMNQLKKYYDEVLARIRDADAILILGPGEAKGELIDRIKRKKLPGCIVERETADKMTDRQIAAKVSRHFAMTSANKSVTFKKTAQKRIAKKKTAKATSRQPTKKSKK